MKKIISLIIASIILVVTLSLSTYASTYFAPGLTSTQIRNDYRHGHLNILIVPGHEPTQGGAEYLDRRERDLVPLIAAELQKLIVKDKSVTVTSTRDQKGWNPIFDTYFKNNWQNIINWKNFKQADMARQVDVGQVKIAKNVDHNDAAPDTALRLYGINKWVNDNDIDIVLNLHINDTPRKNVSLPGPYTGFAIYVPEHQYSNASSSAELAGYMKKRISSFLQVSNMPKESSGIIEDQDLIALGSFNTNDAASILIEYGYIYEPFFTNQLSDEYFAKRVAMQTYLGLQDYLSQNTIN